VRAYLENLDKKLMRERPGHLRLKDVRTRTVVTRFGPVEIRRRMYLDLETGSYRYLLDERLKLRPRERVTRGVKADAVLLASRHPFREASRLLGWKVSHTSVHAWTQQVGEACRRHVAELRRRVFGLGRALEGAGRRVAALFCEADGVVIRLQREARRVAEAKLAIVHAGWERVHPSARAFRLKDKLVYASMQGAEAFWESVTVLVARRWGNPEAVKVVGGDGAGWVKTALDYFPSAVYQLCRFHLMRWIRRCLGWCPERLRRVLAARDDPEALLYEAGIAVLKAPGPEEEALARELVVYLAANEDGLADYRSRVKVEGMKLRGLGAIEGNVDKKIALRMKKRGMAWTRRGAENMLALLGLEASGMPLPAVWDEDGAVEKRPEPEARRKVAARRGGAAPVHMPILDSGRPLAKALRRLAAPQWPL